MRRTHLALAAACVFAMGANVTLAQNGPPDRGGPGGPPADINRQPGGGQNADAATQRRQEALERHRRRQQSHALRDIRRDLDLDSQQWEEVETLLIELFTLRYQLNATAAQAGGEGGQEQDERPTVATAQSGPLAAAGASGRGPGGAAAGSNPRGQAGAPAGRGGPPPGIARGPGGEPEGARGPGGAPVGRGGPPSNIRRGPGGEPEGARGPGGAPVGRGGPPSNIRRGPGGEPEGARGPGGAPIGRGGPPAGIARGPGGEPEGARGPGGAPVGQAQQGPASNDPFAAESKVAQYLAELEALLEDENTEPQIIDATLEQLRSARADYREQLEDVQEQLREMLPSRQEGILVSKGILD